MKKSTLKYSFFLLLSIIAFMSFATAATYTIPSSIDSTGTNDVSTDLQTWINSLPNGSKILGPPGARYRVEFGINIENKVGVDLDAVDANNPPRLFQTLLEPYGANNSNNRNRQVLAIRYGGNNTLRNWILQGGQPNSGYNGQYIAALEAQHGLLIGGIDGLIVEDVFITEVAGDFIYIVHPRVSGVTTQTKNLVIRGVTGRKNGRQGVGVVGAINTLIENNDFQDIKRSAFDIEPNTGTGTVQNLTVRNNIFGTFSNNWVAGAGDGEALIDQITFRDNEIIGRPLAFSILGKTKFSINPLAKRRSNIIVENNRAHSIPSVSTTGATVMTFTGIDNVRVVNNTVDFNGTKQIGYGIMFQEVCGITYFGNRWGNAQNDHRVVIGYNSTTNAPIYQINGQNLEWVNCSSINSTTPPDTTAPVVNTNHNPQSNITSITPITITATASDSSSVSIDLFVDGSLAKSCSVATTCVYQTTFSAGSHTYYASATDSSNNTGTSITTSLVSTAVANDVTPPTAVIVKGRGLSDSEIELRWNASTDDVGVAGYNIYRNSNFIETTIFTTFKDSGLIADTQYEYFIETYDGVNHTNRSQPINVTTLSVGVTAPRSSGGGGGGSSINTIFRTSKTPSTTQTQNLIKAGPNIRNIINNFDRNTGIKQVEVRVRKEVQNIGVSISNYDKIPEEVSVQKPGKVYKYLQVETENINEDLENATITSQVEKSWASENKLDKEEIALFKFDETTQRWNELPTTFTEEDETYYYYDTELNGFSYFVIGQKEESLQVSSLKIVAGIILVLVGLIVVLLFLMLQIRNRVSSPSPKFDRQRNYFS